MEGQMAPQKKGGKGGLILGIVNLLFIILLAAVVVGMGVASLTSDGDSEGGILSAGGSSSSELSEIYEKVSPSVVYLFTTDTKLALDEFGQIVYQQTGALGSGFVYDEDGYIVTNAHVVADDFGTKISPSVQVAFPGTKKVYVAKVLAADALNDIAIVKIQDRNLPTSEFGNIEDVKVGDTAIAVGSPGGAESHSLAGNLQNSMTVGVVSGLERSFGVIGVGAGLQFAGEIPETVPSLAHNDLIQTDAAINHGNSGGPLFNDKGEVIGINTLGDTSGGRQGMGFAVPVDTVKRIAMDVKDSGKLTTPYIGLATVTMDEISAKQYGFKVDEGAMVFLTLPNSPAANSKILPLDVITSVNGEKVSSASEYEAELIKSEAGDTITLEVNSNGARNTVKIKSIETPFLKGI